MQRECVTVVSRVISGCHITAIIVHYRSQAITIAPGDSFSEAFHHEFEFSKLKTRTYSLLHCR